MNRLTATIVEVVVRAPMAARKFQPGQFYRLQNFETLAPRVDESQGAERSIERDEARLAMEGLALTGAWVDAERGLLGTIVLEMGGSSRLCAALRPGEPIVLMGPTGQPTEIVEPGDRPALRRWARQRRSLLDRARFQGARGRVLYFAGYSRGEDLFKQEDIERWTDQVIWCTDRGRGDRTALVRSDEHFRGNIVQAMVAYARGELGRATRDSALRCHAHHRHRQRRHDERRSRARHGVLAPLLDPNHIAIGSINSPMQCMMKEVCAQCLQKLNDPETGREQVVFMCFNQDQQLDAVDFDNLRERLRANSMQEKLANAWLDEVLKGAPDLIRI